jgi:hypothetical protein
VCVCVCGGRSLSVERSTLELKHVETLTKPLPGCGSVSLDCIPFDFSQSDISLIRRWMVQVSLRQRFFRGKERKYLRDFKRASSSEICE